MADEFLKGQLEAFSNTSVGNSRSPRHPSPKITFYQTTPPLNQFTAPEWFMEKNKRENVNVEYLKTN